MMYVFLFSLRYDLGKTAGVLFILAGDAYDIVRNGDLENVIRRFFFLLQRPLYSFWYSYFCTHHRLVPFLCLPEETTDIMLMRLCLPCTNDHSQSFCSWQKLR